MTQVRRMQHDMERDIDIIIPMVFPGDAVWQCDFARHTGRDLDTTVNVRYRSWDTEELLVRCCLEYMPWLRQIIILLAGESQVQPWMMTTPKVRVVFHREFMSEDCLPCFASPCIEMFLHHIPDLSEQFIYINDDMFPLSPLMPEDFFTSDGKPCMHIYEEDAPEFPNIFQRKCIFQQNIVGAAYGWHSIDTWLRTGHGFAPMLKSNCQEVWRRHGDEITRHLSPLKRTDHSYNHYIYMLLAYFSKDYNDHAPRTRLIEWSAPTDELPAIIAEPDCGILCINDNDAMSDWQRRGEVVKEAIEKKLKQQTSEYLTSNN